MSGWFEHFGFAEVGDDLLMGAYPQDADDVAALRGAGVTRVFNLVQDIEYDPGARDACEAALAEAGIEERRVELVDYGNLPPEQIEDAAQAVLAWLRGGRARVRALPRGLAALGRGRRRDRHAARGRRARRGARGPAPAQADRQPALAPARDLVRWWDRRSA